MCETQYLCNRGENHLNYLDITPFFTKVESDQKTSEFFILYLLFLIIYTHNWLKTLNPKCLDERHVCSKYKAIASRWLAYRRIKLGNRSYHHVTVQGCQATSTVLCKEPV